ncbi:MULTISPECIES: hypothetical protein [unclassified Moorena]|uniref:hypothetical protein n=1 Tax=unclassified Moorena TaxID=2683338 RepID=UPI0025D543C0|nr:MULTISPECIES: hypothetical protein [unclassified Moorena]
MNSNYSSCLNQGVGNRESGVGEMGRVWEVWGGWEVWEVWEVWGDGEMGNIFIGYEVH